MKLSIIVLSLFLCVQSLLCADYPHYFVNDVNETGKANTIQLLNGGMISFQKRIDLIKKAKERISIEYFIWEKDKAGLLLFHELIEKAKEGVTIRIILDKSITVLEMDEYIAEALKEMNIELRYYNRAMDPMTAQLRTHRKLFVIDGKEGITGGRNIGDDYFAFDEVYNFLDRDIYIAGPVAKAMQDSFDDFWRSSIVKLPKPVDSNFTASRLSRGDRRNRARYNNTRGRRNNELRKEAREWLTHREEMPAVAKKMEQLTRPILKNIPMLSCPRVTYASDAPGAKALTLVRDEFQSKYRILRAVLFDFMLNKTKGDYYLASPYFMLNRKWQEVLSRILQDPEVRPLLFTNSLGSTDAFYVAANFYRIAPQWREAGLDIRVHSNYFDELYPTLNSLVSQSRWGVHEKTQVFNDEAFYIGTYNIDNRSDLLNAEMGIFCEGSKELTDLLRKDMRDRYHKGYQFIGEGEAINSVGKKVDYYGNATEKLIKIMKAFGPLAKLFEPLM